MATDMVMTTLKDEHEPTKFVQQSRLNARQDEWSAVLEHIGQKRDEGAFSRLFEHFSPLIRGFILSNSSMRLPADAAEELIQEVMIKVWQKSTTFDATKAAASTWIFTITRNARIDYIRKNARHSINTTQLESEDIWDQESDNQPFVSLEKARYDADLKQRLATLPEEQALCLKKMYLEDKSHTQISEELQLPLGTVKSRVRLGLKRLKSAVPSA